MATSPVEITNTMFTMADENIRRMDFFITQMDMNLHSILGNNGDALMSFYQNAQISWLNMQNKVSEMDELFAKQTDKKIEELNIYIANPRTLKSTSQQVVCKLCVKIASNIHKGIDIMGIGIMCKKRNKEELYHKAN